MKCIILFFTICTNTVLCDAQTFPSRAQVASKSLSSKFSKVSTGSTFGEIGSYAAISSDDKSLSFAGSLLKKNEIFSLELSGGATEGVLKLFDNAVLNSNLGVEFKYHHLLKNPLRALNIIEYEKVKDEFNALTLKLSYDTLAIGNSLTTNKLSYKKKEKEISDWEGKLKSIQIALAVPRLSKEVIDSLKLIESSITYEISKAKLDLSALAQSIHEVESNGTLLAMNKRFSEYNTQQKNLIRKVEQIGIEEFDISWFSLGIKLKNNSFKYYNPNILTSMNIIDTSYADQKFSCAYSRCRSTVVKKSDIFWSLGATFTIGTSLASLSKIEIEESQQIQQTPQRAIIKKITAYSGNYKEQINELNLYYELYKYFGIEKDVMAVHFNPVLSLGKRRPIYSFQIGMLIPFINTNSQTSKVNLEVFYKLTDFINPKTENGKQSKSNTFGIRVIFPANLINLN